MNVTWLKLLIRKIQQIHLKYTDISLKLGPANSSISRYFERDLAQTDLPPYLLLLLKLFCFYSATTLVCKQNRLTSHFERESKEDFHRCLCSINVQFICDAKLSIEELDIKRTKNFAFSFENYGIFFFHRRSLWMYRWILTTFKHAVLKTHSIYFDVIKAGFQ